MQKEESIYHNLYIEQELLSSIEDGDKETVLKYYYEFQQETLFIFIFIPSIKTS